MSLLLHSAGFGKVELGQEGSKKESYNDTFFFRTIRPGKERGKVYSNVTMIPNPHVEKTLLLGENHGIYMYDVGVLGSMY